MHSLKNGSIEMKLDGRGLLLSLKSKDSKHDYAGGQGLWRLIYSDGLELEREVKAEDCVPEIKKSEDSLSLRYKKMRDERGELKFSLEISAKLKGDEIVWSAELANHEEGKVIRELHFPQVRSCKLKEGQRLIWSHAGGERFKNVHKEVRSRHTQYIAKDNMEVRLWSLYPGMSAANAFTLEDGEEGLYFGSHDPDFKYTLHLLGATESDLNIGMVKFPYLEKGGKWRAEGYVLSPYRGTWREAASKYRAWASSWFKPAPVAKHVQEMSGWQRIILRHQYGEVHYRYDQLEQIYRDGISAGIDTLFMFGWHRDGHDAGYPEYEFDEGQGGFEALKENVAKFRKAGGKVILYFNGQLIDMNTKFYRETGKRISVKKADGNEHMEVYPFGGAGTALRLFGNKTFVTACPACREWHEVLKGFVDKAVALGVDGVFFDQLGFLSQPCFDKSHGHPVPLIDIRAKAEMLKGLKDYAKSKNPEMSIGIEWLSDVTAQHVDYVHNMDGGSRAVNDWKGKGEKPELRTFMEWFYYMFPEVRTTDREIRDDTDIERRVNRALLKGLRSDVEIYRCRRTIAETPRYREYLAKANELRAKYRNLILNGEYRDSETFSVDSEELDASSFERDGRIAVLLTQSHRPSIKAKLKAPGCQFLEAAGLNGFKATPCEDGSIDVEIGKDALLIAIFETI